MTVWENIIGHEWAVEALAGAIKHERVGHAYLLTGPDQVGKTTLARAFAQALNCSAPVEERPCGVCRSCRLIAEDHHPDVRLLTPEISARGKPSFKIEQIRQLQQELNLSAYEGRYRVAILKRFDAATIGAANAFLKILEEPPKSVVLLLTAADPDSVLPTVASRCRNVHLRPLPRDLVEQTLMTRWQAGPDQAELLAHLADGRLGWAVQATKDATVLEAREQHLAALHEALRGSRVRRFALADKLARKPETVPGFLSTWLSWWRDAALLAHTGGSNGHQLHISNFDEQEQLSQYVRSWKRNTVVLSFRRTEEALWQLAYNANTRLVIENLLLTYPRSQ